MNVLIPQRICALTLTSALTLTADMTVLVQWGTDWRMMEELVSVSCIIFCTSDISITVDMTLLSGSL